MLSSRYYVYYATLLLSLAFAGLGGRMNPHFLWPLLLTAPTLLVVLILSLIRAVQVFDVVFAFTGGGPGTATQYMVQFIYNNGFAAPIKRYGIASAASLIMAIVLVVSTMVQFRLQGGDEDAASPTRFPAWTDITPEASKPMSAPTTLYLAIG